MTFAAAVAAMQAALASVPGLGQDVRLLPPGEQSPARCIYLEESVGFEPAGEGATAATLTWSAIVLPDSPTDALATRFDAQSAMLAALAGLDCRPRLARLDFAPRAPGATHLIVSITATFTFSEEI